MAKIRLGNVINRWGDDSFSAHNTDTIDNIHRRIRDKGTFDRDDLDAILAHYSIVDPDGIRGRALEIDDLYQKLDDIGEFKDIVPQPNSDMLDDFEWEFQKEEDGHDGTDWYVPGIIYGSASNYGADNYISLNRYDNKGFCRPEDTGYEIEFEYDEGYPLITLADVPKTP